MDRVPLESVQDKSEATSTPIVEKPYVDSSSGYMDDINYHRVSEFLDISYEERRDHNMAQKINYLIDWAKDQTRSDDRIVQMEAIKNYIRGLGITYKGEELVKYLYKFLRLDQQRKRVEKEMSLINAHDRP